LLASVLIPASNSGAAGETTERVNTQPDGSQSNQPGGGLYPTVSKDGDRVVFVSAATDILDSARDNGGRYQVYMRDRSSNKTKLISVNSQEKPGDGNSFLPIISADGKSVVFQSDSSNLVPNDDNGLNDAFLRDLDTGKTYLISDTEGKCRHSAKGESWPTGISNDGTKVAFVSTAADLVKAVTDGNGVADVFHWQYSIVNGDLRTKTRLVSHNKDSVDEVGNAVSGGALGASADRGGAAISGDGDCMAFGSRATDLAAAKDKNQGEVDVFIACGLVDEPAFGVHLVSRAEDGTQGNGASYAPSLNLNGRKLAYYSTSSNLLYLDTNGGPDIFVAHLSDSFAVTSLDRANLGNSRGQDNAGATLLGSQALSNDGNRVAFATFSRLVKPNDCVGEQVYLRDMAAGTTKLVSIMTNGKCGDRFSNYANISRDGRWVVWTGAANKLVLNDTNNDQYEFIRGPF
jgi:Tol biopolymer transport system component